MFVSGHKALVEKLRVDVSRSKAGNIPEISRRYAEDLKKMNVNCSKSKI